MQLEEREFRYRDFDVVELLRSKDNYIRFHNQKAKRLFLLKERWDFIEEILELGIEPREKRDKLISQINGYGLKEASHFMRNIGYRNLAILDRHILKALFECGVIESDTSIGSRNRYLDVENKFAEYSNEIGIPMDELDLLFWYLAAGEIIK
ncbi:MAG: hypothetical protein Kapaf2KO_06010 [Candidatus Kapaibacteriales bacterium]